MAQFSMEIMRLTGSVLRGNQQRNPRLERARNCQSGDSRESPAPVIRLRTTGRHVRHRVHFGNAHGFDQTLPARSLLRSAEIGRGPQPQIVVE